MQQQTQEQGSGERRSLEEIGQRHGFGIDAVEAMLGALRRGSGSMAQFDHAEFSGSGQWMRGGMTMISDMSNDRLKSRVAALAADLSAWLDRRPPQAAAPREGGDQGVRSAGSAADAGAQGGSSGGWWPADLSHPASSGSQNQQRYAWFPDARRLVVDDGSEVCVYDTQGHLIEGVSQQQSGRGSMTFRSQHGTVEVGELPLVSREPSRR